MVLQTPPIIYKHPVQHSRMKDSESCFDDCAVVTVHWAGNRAVSYKGKAVK